MRWAWWGGAVAMVGTGAVAACGPGDSCEVTATCPVTTLPTNQGGGSPTTSTTSSSMGGSGPCEPGTTVSCYGGPDGTQDVGICRAGEATCDAEGTGFGACVGTVLPAIEDCSTPDDEDCNGTAPNCSGAHRNATQLTTDIIFSDVAHADSGDGYFAGSARLGLLVDGDDQSHTLDAGLVRSPLIGKTNPDGTLAWSMVFGDVATYQYSNSLAAHPDGGVVMAGRFNGTVNFGNGAITQSGGEDVYVAKLDAEGEPEWVRQIDLDSYAWDLAVAVTANGDVVLFTDFGTAAHLDGQSYPAAGANDLLLVSFAGTNGETQWTKHLGGGPDEQARHIAIGGGQGVIAGTYAGTTNLDGQSLPAPTGTDVFVATFSLNDGSFTAAAPFDVSYARLAVLPDGSPVVGTTVSGSASLNGTVVNASSSGDIVLAKLGTDLSVAGMWQGSADRTGALADIAADALGHVTMVASIEGTVVVGSDNVVPIGVDALVVKLDWNESAPAPLWHQVNTGTGEQLGTRVDVNEAGEPLVLGAFPTSTSLATGVFLSEDTSLDASLDFFLQRREP